MKTRTLQILDEQYQQIDEGLWDRTKAKAAGIGSFITSGSKRSEAYQNTAQSKLIDGKIAKIAKIISKLEDDVMKSTGLTMADIKTKHPAIFNEIEKIKRSVSAGPAPAPTPPLTFNSAINNFYTAEGIIRTGLDYNKFIKFINSRGGNATKIFADAGVTPKRGTIVSNKDLTKIKQQLISAGVFSS